MKERREEEVGTCPSFAVEKSATGTGGRLLLSWAPGDWTELGRGVCWEAWREAGVRMGLGWAAVRKSERR